MIVRCPKCKQKLRVPEPLKHQQLSVTNPKLLTADTRYSYFRSDGSRKGWWARRASDMTFFADHLGT